MKKKTLIKLLFVIIIACINNITFANEKLLITVNQFVKYSALDASYDGFYKALNDRKFYLIEQKLLLLMLKVR